MTPNRARGEVSVRIAGKDYIMCLTMGALARIETAIEARSLADLTNRLMNVTTDRLMKVAGVLLEAGGNPVSRAEMEDWPPTVIGELTNAVEAAFTASQPPAKEGEEAERPQPVTGPSPGASGSAGSADTASKAA